MVKEKLKKGFTKKLARDWWTYLLFIANTIYSIRHGFTRLYWVSAALTAALFTLSVSGVIIDAKQ